MSRLYTRNKSRQRTWDAFSDTHQPQQDATREDMMRFTQVGRESTDADQEAQYARAFFLSAFVLAIILSVAYCIVKYLDMRNSQLLEHSNDTIYNSVKKSTITSVISDKGESRKAGEIHIVEMEAIETREGDYDEWIPNHDVFSTFRNGEQNLPEEISEDRNKRVDYDFIVSLSERGLNEVEEVSCEPLPARMESESYPSYKHSIQTFLEKDSINCETFSQKSIVIAKSRKKNLHETARAEQTDGRRSSLDETYLKRCINHYIDDDSNSTISTPFSNSSTSNFFNTLWYSSNPKSVKAGVTSSNLGSEEESTARQPPQQSWRYKVKHAFVSSHNKEGKDSQLTHRPVDLRNNTVVRLSQQDAMAIEKCSWTSLVTSSQSLIKGDPFSLALESDILSNDSSLSKRKLLADDVSLTSSKGKKKNPDSTILKSDSLSQVYNDTEKIVAWSSNFEITKENLRPNNAQQKIDFKQTALPSSWGEIPGGERETEKNEKKLSYLEDKCKILWRKRTNRFRDEFTTFTENHTESFQPKIQIIPALNKSSLMYPFLPNDNPLLTSPHVIYPLFERIHTDSMKRKLVADRELQLELEGDNSHRFEPMLSKNDRINMLMQPSTEEIEESAIKRMMNARKCSQEDVIYV